VCLLMRPQYQTPYNLIGIDLDINDQDLARKAASLTVEVLGMGMLRLRSDHPRMLVYPGAYNIVQRYVKKWRVERGREPDQCYIPLRFAPGEAYQFDWSHEKAILAGIPQTIKVAHFRLSHSRMFLVIAYPRASQEMVFDAHNRAFKFFKGTCRRGIYETTSKQQ
jgi:transposase